MDELDASMEILTMEVAKLFAQVSHQVEVHGQFRDTDWETAFSGVSGLVVMRILLCTSTILESNAVTIPS